MSRLVDTLAAELATGIPAATQRQWLHRGRLTHHGHDYYGRAIVDLDEIEKIKTQKIGACRNRETLSH